MQSVFAAALAKARRVIHDTFYVNAAYVDPYMPMAEPLRVRWHSNMAITGDLSNEGYGNIVETINAITFDREELVARGVTVHRGGQLTMLDPGWDNAVLIIGAKMETDGPIEEVWQAVRA